MSGNLLSFLQCSAIQQICRYSRSTEAVAADGISKPRGARPAFDYCERLTAVEAVLRQIPLPVERAKKGDALPTNASGRNHECVQVFFCLVMCRHVVPFPALLMQPEPPSFSLLEEVLHVHCIHSPN